MPTGYAMPEAIRARHIIPLLSQGPARGPEALYASLDILEDAVVLSTRGRITGLESFTDFSRRPASEFVLTDLGEVCIAPGFVNAHCHLELSHLAGKTTPGEDFAVWLSSLIALLRQKTDPVILHSAITGALEALHDSGVAHTGDVTSRRPLEVSAIAASLADSWGLPYPLTHFLESIGFVPNPQTGMAEGYAPFQNEKIPVERRANFAVAGHALYSTGAEALRAASYWCWERGRVFSLHLAESLAEEELLGCGQGPLRDILGDTLLPADWTEPGLGAVDYAMKLHLLTPFTLAVHCVHVSENDMERLALSGTNVCLCPRSNEYVGVGRAKAVAMAEAGVLLCLGTDGLTSNHDLDMQKEMLAAMKLYQLPGQAVLRMATANGAYALGLGHLGSLAPGNAAVWSVLCPELAEALLP
ncbi:amidohydrolase family protein [Desulfovibrio sp. OttesenSCG-928-M16]|nr:amidohydrolase family protein [Desulfovibrio sp. OttesenSCG-928-M16]